MKKKLVFTIKKHRRSLIVIVSIFSFISLLFVIWFNFLWTFLMEFQKSVPYAPVSDIVSSLKSGEYENVISKIDNLPEELQDAKSYEQYIQEFTEDDIIYYSESTNTQSNLKSYDIKIGKTKIMEVVMESQSEKSSYDLLQYEMKSCQAIALTSYTIMNYSDDQILVNQKELSNQYFVEETQYSDNGVDIPFAHKTYKIDDLMYIKDIQLANHPSDVHIDHENNVIRVYNKIDEELENEIKDFAKTVLHPYLIFSTANQGSRYNLLQYVYPYSNLNYAINEYFNTYGMLYVSDELRNLVIDEIIAYSDTEYSCHVSVEYVVTQSDGIQKSYDFGKGFYITSRNGYYQLVDMVNE